MTTVPTVSCLMAVYNGMPFLEEAVRSILQQSYEDFEFLIVDDGSTDETPSILAQFAADDPRIQIVPGMGEGQTKALNKGLSVARGQYIARMDADDISDPTRFSQQVQFLEQRKNVVAVGTMRRTIDADGHVLKTQKRPRQVTPNLTAVPPRYQTLVHPSAMIRRGALEAVGGYRAFFRYAQDVDLWLRLAAHGELHVLPQVLLSYRSLPSAVSSAKAVEQQRFAVSAVLSAIARDLCVGDPVEMAEPEMMLEACLGALHEHPDPAGLRLWAAARFARIGRRDDLPADVARLLNAERTWRMRDFSSVQSALWRRAVRQV